MFPDGARVMRCGAVHVLKAQRIYVGQAKEEDGMRRKVGVPRQVRTYSAIYGLAALALAAYGVPRLPKLEHGVAGTFSALWLLLLALYIGANLYFWLGADRERARQLEEAAVQSPDRDERPGRTRLRARG